MASEREILAFVARVEADEALIVGVHLDTDSPLAPRLLARFKDQGRDDPPPALRCDPWDVRSLVARGHLSQRGPLIGITEAGRRYLGGPP